MFSNSKNTLPEIFQMKQRVDKIIQDLFALPVIPLDAFREAKRDRNAIRAGCEKFIQRQRGPSA